LVEKSSRSRRFDIPCVFLDFLSWLGGLFESNIEVGLDSDDTDDNDDNDDNDGDGGLRVGLGY
jgi:hypothetical protein